jgi:LuxR family transcriptional regulator, maltose regulon positive regulatory protein
MKSNSSQVNELKLAMTQQPYSMTLEKHIVTIDRGAGTRPLVYTTISVCGEPPRSRWVLGKQNLKNAAREDAAPRPATITLDMQSVAMPQPLGVNVTRERLLAHLDQHTNCRARVIIAPSGYGKTTLVAQYLRQTRANVVWVEAVADDADVFHFAASLHRAIKKNAPDAMLELTALLETATTTHTLGAALKHDLSQLALELVIDNSEHLGAEVRQWLSELVDADLGATHLWVIGYDLEHFRFARLISKGQALIVTQAELRFDAAETAQLFEAHRSSQNPEQVRSMLDGWPAGVGLVARGISPHVTPTDLIFDAISQLPEALRTQLPEAAVLEVWSADDALELGCELPSGWLSAVKRAGLPLVQISADAYRPHTTLLEALEQQLKTDPSRHRELHVNAAKRAVKRQELLSAIRHNLCANARDSAIETAQILAQRLSARGEHGLVCSVLDEIGAPLPPNLSGLLGVALIETGASERGEALLEDLRQRNQLTPNGLFALGKLELRKGNAQLALEYARQGQQLEGTRLESGRCRRLEGWALINLEHFEAAQKLAELEVARADADQDLTDLAAALLLASRAYSKTRKHALVESSLLRSIEVNQQLGNVSDVAVVRNQLANQYRFEGKFALAHEQLQQAISITENSNNEVVPYLYDTMGEVLLAENRASEACVFFRKAITTAKHLKFEDLIADIQLQLVEGLYRSNQSREAAALLNAISISDQQSEYHQFLSGLLAFQTNTDQALQHFNNAILGLNSEYALRTRVLQAELHRRTNTVQTNIVTPQHREFIHQALDHHGFGMVLLTDSHLTQSTLEQIAKEPWFPNEVRQHMGISSAENTLVQLEVQTLGQRRVLVNGSAVQVRLAKSFEVLVYLLRHGTSSREAILDAIWDEDTPQSQRYFKVAVRRLRSDLRTHPSIDFDAVTFDEQRYAVNPAFDIHLDHNELETAIHSADQTRLEKILESIQGEFLPEASSHWVQEQRDQSAEHRLLGWSKLGHRWLATNPTGAAQAFRHALALDPLNDERLLDLVRALLRSGDSIGATQAVQRYSNQLQRELGDGISQQMQKQLKDWGVI